MPTIMTDDTNTGKPERYSSLGDSSLGDNSVGDNSAGACSTGGLSTGGSRAGGDRAGDDRTGRNTKRLFVPPQLSHEADFVGVTASKMTYS